MSSDKKDNNEYGDDADEDVEHRQTGRYRIRPLTKPVEIPAAAKGMQWESLAGMIMSVEERRDKLERERRYAESAYRSYVDDRLAEQDKNIEDLSVMMTQTAGTLRDLGTSVAALKEIPIIVDALRGLVDALQKDVRLIRGCVRKMERDVRDLRVSVESTTSEQATLSGRVLTLEVRYKEIADVVHKLEEYIEYQREDDDDGDDDGDSDDEEGVNDNESEASVPAAKTHDPSRAITVPPPESDEPPSRRRR